MPFGPTVCQRHARTKPKSSERLHKPGLGSAKPSGLARTSTTELRFIPLTPEECTPSRCHERLVQ